MILSIEHVQAWLTSVSPETLAAVERLKAQFASLSADGLTLEDLTKLMHSATDELMHSLVPVSPDVAGADKRDAVLAILAYLFDQIPVLPLPAYLIFFRPLLTSVVRPFVRAYVLRMAAGVLESLYARYFKFPQLRLFPPSA
jgi:hypothetical protein